MAGKAAQPWARNSLRSFVSPLAAPLQAACLQPCLLLPPLPANCRLGAERGREFFEQLHAEYLEAEHEQQLLEARRDAAAVLATAAAAAGGAAAAPAAPVQHKVAA